LYQAGQECAAAEQQLQACKARLEQEEQQRAAAEQQVQAQHAQLVLAEQDHAAAKQQAADSETQLQAAQQQVLEEENKCINFILPLILLIWRHELDPFTALFLSANDCIVSRSFPPPCHCAAAL